MHSDLAIANGKRILLCAHQFFPHFSAGTEVLTLSTAQALKEEGYAVEIVTAQLGAQDTLRTRSYNHKGFTVHQLEIPYIAGKFSSTIVVNEYNNPSVYTPFKNLLEQIKPDLVHFFHLKNLTLSALQACIDSKIPTVYTPTDYWINCRSCQLVKPWGKNECPGPSLLAGNCLKHIVVNNRRGIVRKISAMTPQLLFSTIVALAPAFVRTRLRSAAQAMTDLRDREQTISQALLKIDQILPPTQFIENLLISAGVPQQKIRRLKYGIQPPIIYPVAPDLINTAKKRAAIGFIGTLSDHKGCHVLIQAIKLIPNIDADFLIYGDIQQNPDYLKKLKSISQGDPRIRFVGTFPHENIGNILSTLDVLVIPSTWRENAPLVLLNALACGTPVIASDVTGITEYLGEEDNVTVFKPGNAQELAQQLKSYLALGGEPAHNRGAGRIAGEPLHAYVSVLSGVYADLIQIS
ncbi:MULTISPECIES: glycosyltransferase [unclassified Pseudomonas]|uniref:glycosyltransferase n=1 Tax=unclassified Pseudomonas TaxID=196821 RepID=UPI000A1F0736|nr:MULTISPECIES: glycosyltransferase [unclassified Pseudomonas]MCX4219528.1 glycosyltransferase [Pseudomonas sp. MCal1]UDI91411.1 glycosyltransferase [Pseudomonas sp. IAC-BECa141]